MSPSRSVWSSWSQMLMSGAGEHWEDVTILSVRSDGLGKFGPGFDRCGRALWVIPPRLRSPNGRVARAHRIFSKRERPHVCVTGHSRLSLLCRVLAEGVSAPSARKFRSSVNLAMDPDQNPQTCSKRDLERSRRL